MQRLRKSMVEGAKLLRDDMDEDIVEHDGEV
jgi:hypothetical protein